jgi:3-deoxy-manno-octulosonate cytidylyltransferase (CMP-KDO synthetase)
MTTTETLIIIPAHLASGRLPGKALLVHKGRTLLEWTHHQAFLSGYRVIVASGHDDISQMCKRQGIEYVDTPLFCTNGTERCIHVAKQFPEYPKVINWQVDEPLVPIEYVRTLELAILPNYPHIIWTITAPFREQDRNNPDVVKVILGDTMYSNSVLLNRCHWFTRSPIQQNVTGHCGIYGFNRDTLLALESTTTAYAARTERLEQLSWITGNQIMYATVEYHLPLSINTPEDWKKFTREV